MTISELTIRGFKSFGNNEQVLKLNTEKGELILLMGKNGNGKSVVKETVIDVCIDLSTMNKDEYSFIYELTSITKSNNDIGKITIHNSSMLLKMTLEDLNTIQNRLSIIDKRLIKVKTPNGEYKIIKAIGITSPNSEKIIIKTTDFELSGSPNHRVKFRYNWIFLKDIKKGDIVDTENGEQLIISVKKDNNKEDLWDIEVEGSEYYTNGILSHNSSLLESVEYCIYGKVKSGKSKKWAKLSTLPNRINGEMLNTIKFNSNGVEVTIKRGISPNVLELTENKVVFDKSGKSNIDDRIEKYIEMDVESFKSFISMSINDFKNFISLSNEEKKLLLDKLFNLEVINTLNGIVKDINKNNKKRLDIIETEIRTLDESINSIKESINKFIKSEKENIQEEIDEIKKTILLKKDEYEELKNKISKISEKEKIIEDEIESERKELNRINNEIKNVDREIDLYNSGKCPTCGNDFKTELYTELKLSLNKKKIGFVELKENIEKNILSIKEKEKKLRDISNKANETFNTLNYMLNDYKRQINTLKSKKDSQSYETMDSIQEFKNTIKNLDGKKNENLDVKNLCKEKELFYKELNDVLSEDGVKKTIIKGIVKPINHFIKENISKMGLPFDVILDETFSSDIRQLGSSVDYESLSTGETKLINICILVAYLKLIRTKKHINILFLDEVFSSIDIDNIQKILDLLKSFSDEYKINIFVVHHAILNQEMFDRIIHVEKNVFSNIIEVVD